MYVCCCPKHRNRLQGTARSVSWVAAGLPIGCMHHGSCSSCSSCSPAAALELRGLRALAGRLCAEQVGGQHAGGALLLLVAAAAAAAAAGSDDGVQGSCCLLPQLARCAALMLGCRAGLACCSTQPCAAAGFCWLLPMCRSPALPCPPLVCAVLAARHLHPAALQGRGRQVCAGALRPAVLSCSRHTPLLGSAGKFGAMPSRSLPLVQIARTPPLTPSTNSQELALEDCGSVWWLRFALDYWGSLLAIGTARGRVLVFDPNTVQVRRVGGGQAWHLSTSACSRPRLAVPVHVCTRFSPS